MSDLKDFDKPVSPLGVHSREDYQETNKDLEHLNITSYGNPILPPYPSNLIFKDAFYLPSGRVFLLESGDGYPLECTEMRDVSIGGKQHQEVRTSLDPHVIWKHLVSYRDKWLLTVSTQKGCQHFCHFCDCASLPFKGNLTTLEIIDQVKFILESTPYVKTCNKAKIGFARMGEPAHNLENVIAAIKHLPVMTKAAGKRFKWLPCFNSILPRKTVPDKYSGHYVIYEVMKTKEKDFNGFLHFQISCNSTDEDKRKELFGGADVLTMKEIITAVNECDVTNRTVTLNFIAMKGVPVDVEYLMKLGLNPKKFMVKLIPLNATNNAGEHKLETVANYENYEDLVELGKRFNHYGIPTCVDAIAKCEEAGLCCGQLAHIFANGE